MCHRPDPMQIFLTKSQCLAQSEQCAMDQIPWPSLSVLPRVRTQIISVWLAVRYQPRDSGQVQELREIMPHPVGELRSDDCGHVSVSCQGALPSSGPIVNVCHSVLKLCCVESVSFWTMCHRPDPMQIFLTKSQWAQIWWLWPVQYSLSFQP